jgi:tRNA threonylcarbamoyladenosine biosynthesis protein TsaE
MDNLIESIVQLSQKGSLGYFYGPLGCGKTSIIRLVIRSILGKYDLNIASPTFSIVNIYSNIYHCDFYRLKTLDEVQSTGIIDEINDNNIVFIEWPDIIEKVIEPSFICKIESGQVIVTIFDT